MSDELSGTDVELFGSLFVWMERLTLRVEDRLGQFGLTSRQWLMLGVLEKAFPDHAPMLSELTAVFGTTHQNVKKVAAQLERGGWLQLRKDPVDRRVVRVVLTDKIAIFHDPAVQADQAAFVLTVFEPLSSRERDVLLDMVSRCIARLTSPENTI
jgi:DNA-binding MarR family transcriptional regulator